jgi:hypothetical protein
VTRKRTTPTDLKPRARAKRAPELMDQMILHDLQKAIEPLEPGWQRMQRGEVLPESNRADAATIAKLQRSLKSLEGALLERNSLTLLRENRDKACDALWSAAAAAEALSGASPQALDAARVLLGVVTHTFGSADGRDAIWLATRMQKRARRHWLDHVKTSLKLFRDTKFPGIASALRVDLVENLGLDLAMFDARAEALTPEQIDKALRGKGKTPEGVAARLAIECGAFGFRNYAHAKDGFRKLRTE